MVIMTLGVLIGGFKTRVTSMSNIDCPVIGVRFTKLKLICKTWLYWIDLKDRIERRDKPSITPWNKIKHRLQVKYLPKSYREKF